MARPMRNTKIMDLLRREAKAVLRLSPWLLLSLLAAALLLSVDLAATSGLFQSPPPTETLPPVPPETPILTDTPVITVTETPLITSTAVLTPTIPPTEIPPTATAVPPTPTATVAPSPTPAAAEPEATADATQRYPEEETGLKFEWGMLFDSLALGASYLWLGCGVLLFVLVPVFFIVLWVASKRRRQGADQQQPGENQQQGE